MAVLPIGMSGEAGGYQIERSLRFNSADSAYLSRTPASAGNRKTWTWSGWVKRSGLADAYQAIFEVFNGNNDNQTLNISFQGSSFGGVRDAIAIGAYSLNWLVTTAVYRDPSAWYHIVLAVDTTQATANNRIRLYVNGSEVTAFGTRNNPTQNADLAINQSAAHYIGSGNARNFFNGYLTDINFIDGQALTPSSFGETDSATGVWKPKAYSGSYGTNGFYLKFADNSGTTSTTLGKDSSGNGNNWTPNNFSVTAGAGNDSLVDTPTPYGTDTGAGGEVRGNYAVMNPLNATGASAANGNLDVTLTSPGSTIAQIRGTIAPTSGKWYWENVITTDGNQSTWFGVVAASTASNISLGSGQSVNQVIYARFDGTKTVNGTNSAYGSSYTTGDVIGVALDLDAGTVTFYKNNTSQGSISLPTTGIAYTPVYWWSSSTSAGAATFNFGQRPFAYTAPSGFKALCTQNLPTPTVVQGDDYFNPVLYTGNGSTQSITGVGFQPDFVWIKRRSGTIQSHNLTDAVRGTNKSLATNATDAEQSPSLYGQVSAFNSDGFTVAPGTSTVGEVNGSGETYVAWNWNAGGSTVTNTAGTISAQVRANPTAGFSIVTYTGTGSAATVGHGLGVAPSMLIIKSRNNAYNWAVWHTSLGGGDNALWLNSTAAVTSAYDYWNGNPTSSVFTLGTDAGSNGSGSNNVAYCFAAAPGFSAFGSYTGNGSTDGPFVHLGFRPRYILVKNVTTGSTQWVIQDTARMPYNAGNNANLLAANSSVQENESSTLLGGSQCYADWLSNGFKIRANNGNWNTSGNTYIYMTFAENPFKYSLAR